MIQYSGPQKSTLSNGMRVLTEQMPGVRSVALGLWIFTGSRNETAEELGITHFTEHMFFKGTKKHDAIAIGQAFNLLGGQFNAFTTQESLCLYARVVDHQLPEALDLLAEMLLDSTFPEDEIKRERNVVLEEIKMSDDTPDDYVIDLFQQNMWPNQCLGRPVLGTPKTVRSFRRTHLMDFLKKHLRADRTVITLAGKFDKKVITHRIASLFESLPENSVDDCPEANLSAAFRQRSAHKPIEQVHFCIGTEAPPRAHKDRYALGLASTILGGGMGSRLFEEIREKRGLTYCISSFNGAFMDAGYLGITGSCSPRTIQQVFDISIHESRRMYHELVSEDELNRARQQLVSQTLFNQESTMSRMMYLAESYYYWKRFISVQEIVDNLAKIKPKDILEVSRRYMAEKPLCGAAVGPVKLPLRNMLPQKL